MAEQITGKPHTALEKAETVSAESQKFTRSVQTIKKEINTYQLGDIKFIEVVQNGEPYSADFEMIVKSANEKYHPMLVKTKTFVDTFDILFFKDGNNYVAIDNQQVLSQIKANIINVDNIVLLDVATHTVFDRYYKPISVPLVFDYSSSLKQFAPVDDVYDELIKRLKQHPYTLELSES